MATIENLKLVVDADIGSAIVKLQDLQEELKDVADKLRSVRSAGRRGISVRTNVDDITDDLARVATEIEAFERAYDLDIDTDVGGLGGGVNPAAAGAALGGTTGAGNTARGTSLGLGTLFSGLSDARGADGLGGTLSSLSQTLSDVNRESSITNINMSDLHNILARLVPLLIVFVGAIPAAYTAMVGLAAAGFSAAAALAAIAGFGALGVAMEGGQFETANLEEIFEDIREDFLNAFTPLANELEPLFRDAADGLGVFFRAIADEGDALMALTDDARGFGQFMIDFVPVLLRNMAALADSMGRVFGNIGEYLQSNFGPAMATLAEVTARTLPAVADLGQVIAQALPAIARMSIGFVIVSKKIFQFFGLLADLLGLLGISPEVFGLVTAAVLALVSAVALASVVMSSTAVKAVYLYAASLVGLTAHLFQTAAALIGLSISFKLAAVAAAAFWSILTLGGAAVVFGVLEGLTSRFTTLGGSIRGATGALQDFNKVSSDTGGVGFGGGSDSPYKYRPDGTRGGGDVYNIESSGDAEEDRSNIENANWQSGRTTYG